MKGQDWVGYEFDTYNGRCVVINYESFKQVTVKFIDTEYETVTSIQKVKRGHVNNRLYKSFSGFGYLGVGPYKTNTGLGSSTRTPYYIRWAGMVARCYNPRSEFDEPSYIGTTVCDEWANFQNYAEWYCNHPYRNDDWQVDKDLLGKGKKLYSPETCCFVPKIINSIFVRQVENKGHNLPVGVYKSKGKTYNMIFRNIERSHTEFGFKTVEEAAKVYKTLKEDRIKELANEFKSGLEPRVYEALMSYEWAD